MIWQYLPISKLQNLVGEQTIEALNVILPLVDETLGTFHFMSDKATLGVLADSFVSEDYFRSRQNINELLYYLPEDLFGKLCSKLFIDPKRENISKVVEKLKNNKSAFNSFIELFSVSERFWPKEQNIIEPNFILTPPSHEQPVNFNAPFKRLKNYQHLIFEETKAKLFPANSRLIVQMPTGSGKTRTAMEIICEFFLESKTNTTIMWFANSSELCEQAIQCFSETWPYIGNKNVAVHRCWAGYSDNISEELENSKFNFVVCSFQTVWQRIQNNTFPSEKCNLLVVDEAHIALADTYKSSIEKVQRASNCRILGLTATPGRSEEVESNALSGMFHGNLIGLKDPENKIENAIIFLRSKRVLSTIEYLELKSDSEIVYEDEEGNEFSDKLLQRLGADSNRLKLVVERLLPFLKEEKKIILFAPSKSSSKFFSSIFTYLGFTTAHIDGDTPGQTRRSIIRDFNNQKIQLISNYGVLATGFDSPKIDLVCLARPTKSAVLYSQMIGRGLRGPAVGGTEHCTILEVKDNFIGMAMETDLYNIFSDYWNN